MTQGVSGKHNEWSVLVYKFQKCTYSWYSATAGEEENRLIRRFAQKSEVLKSSLFQSLKKLGRKSSKKYCQEWFPKKSESVLQVPRTLDQMPSFEKRSKGQKVIKVSGGLYCVFWKGGGLRYSEGEKKKQIEMLTFWWHFTKSHGLTSHVVVPAGADVM